MEETIIGTFEDVKFIQGQTKMTQPNWQEYFSAGFPNGIYEGLNVYLTTNTADECKIYDGTAFVNGLCVKIKTEDGYTDIARESLTDRFYCLRVNIIEGTAELVMKTGIAADLQRATVAAEIGKFIEDDSYCCDRNEVIYELPLLYGGTLGAPYPIDSGFEQGIDLRRIVTNKLDFHEMNTFTHLSLDIAKDGIYQWQLSTNNFAAPDIINIPNGATIYLYNGSSENPFSLIKAPYDNSGTWMATGTPPTPPVTIKYITTSDSWTTESSPARIQWNFGNGKSTMVLKIHFVRYNKPSANSTPEYTFLVQELDS